MVKFGLNSIITALASIGSYNLLKLFTLNTTVLTITIIVTIVICLIYTALWYEEVDSIEQITVREKLHEDRIPVIGARPLNWDDDLDLPVYDINNSIKFDRNKILYYPKTNLKNQENNEKN